MAGGTHHDSRESARGRKKVGGGGGGPGGALTTISPDAIEEYRVIEGTPPQGGVVSGPALTVMAPAGATVASLATTYDRNLAASRAPRRVTAFEIQGASR
ncbi:MAG: hypothetical protein ABSE73_20085 [Planctomycetota bacterium]